jgi:hypothetical protein
VESPLTLLPSHVTPSPCHPVTPSSLYSGLHAGRPTCKVPICPRLFWTASATVTTQRLPQRAGDWRLGKQGSGKVDDPRSGGTVATSIAQYAREREPRAEVLVWVSVYPSGRVARQALKEGLDEYETSTGARAEKKEDRAGGDYYLTLEKREGATERKPAGALWLYRNRVVYVSGAEGGRADPKELKEFAAAFIPAAAWLWAK